MGWRDSYATLTELFPQVDPRLIKGAALEHGDDIEAAAEFILNDVLGSDEGVSDNIPDSTYCIPKNSLEDMHRQLTEEQAITENALCGRKQEEHGAQSGSSSGAMRSTDQSGSPGFTEAKAQELPGESPDEIHDEIPDEVLTTKEIGGVEPEVSSGGSRAPVEDVVVVPIHHEVDYVSFDPNDILNRFMSSFRSKEVKRSTSDSNLSLDDGHGEVVEENKSEVRIPGEKSEPAVCDPITPSVGISQDSAAAEDVVHIDVISDESSSEFPAWKSEPTSEFEFDSEHGSDSRHDESEMQVQPHEEVFEETEKGESFTATSTGYHFSLEDEFLVPTEVPRSAHEEDEVALDVTVGDSCADNSSSMLLTHKSAIIEEMDKADWEKVSSSSIIQMDQMEPLDALVEEAKVDKEALISSIEEIRVLRLMTDQAEFAARQSRDEAARGGLDVMARVEEMRKMLSLAREANAVHAGEVFGEKAVLATEARELQYRLTQVNLEKAKAVAALNEIKASLQSRIESAVLERASAELEKANKEVLAKEALAKEEALVTKVAQESRDLDAEAEACAKIRDFLIERASIVDALQGEVAVLREDAEALKKDLESMSLSCGGSQIHMLSQAGSEIYSSINSRFGKLSDMYRQPSDSLVEVEDGAVSSGGNSVTSLRSVSELQKSASDKKSWSSLPSLLRGLSGSQVFGSQDLNNSGHSSYSSSGSNLLNSIRDALMVNEDEESPSLGLENLTEIKYPSSPSSTTSPGAEQAERELLKAKMAMFPEDLLTEYSGIQNLDVFRAENSNKSGAVTDEEDWQLLEKASSRSSSSSVGK